MTIQKPSIFAAFFVGLLVASSASAAEAERGALENVVVRNRLHLLQGKFEVSVVAGLSLVNRLTEHYDFNLGVAYNLTEAWALEARGGYALSGQTALARQVGSSLLSRAPSGDAAQAVVVNDLSGLWEMKANGVVGARWAPLYGKISLLAAASVHYQAYVWAGLGGASFHRRSLVYCRAVVDRAAGTCGDWLSADRATVLGSGAFGLRFFTGQHGALTLEMRNYIFGDRFLVKVDRSVSEAGGTTGTLSPRPGLINLVLLNVGYTVIF